MVTRPSIHLAAAAAMAMALAVSGCSGSRTVSSSSPSSSASAAGEPTKSTATTKEVNPAGDIPDDQVFVPFQVPGAPVEIRVPEGWARSEAAGAVTFTDKRNSIRVEITKAPSAPTEESVKANVLPNLAASTKGYAAGKVTTVKRPAGTAILITYRAQADPDPVTRKAVVDDVERYLFWRSGLQLSLTLAGPRGADNVDPWKTVTDSVRWTG